LRRAPVEEVSLAYFAHGHAVYVRPHTAPRFAWPEVIRRARSRLGEDRYGLLQNNCEHFCEWCVQGVPRSRQVEQALGIPSAVARATRVLFTLVRNSCRRVSGSSPGALWDSLRGQQQVKASLLTAGTVRPD